MKDRIRQIMETQHMTQQVFANAIGTTPATLSGIFNDRTRPTINIIESIKKKFPDISLEWLMFGQGDMYQQSPTLSGESSGAPEGASSTPSMGMDEMFDFDPIPHNSNFRPQNSHSAPTYNNGVKNTRSEMAREEVIKVDKPMRHVTEIRVYYDDQTWESFVPAKK